MKVLLIMDPLSTIHIDQDTSFALSIAAQEQGHEVYYAQIGDLMMRGPEPRVRARHLHFVQAEPCYEWRAPWTEEGLDDFGVILMRKDPPFDEEYFLATHFLSLCKKAKVVNRPSSLREAPEKIYGLNFPQICPQTLITRDPKEIKKFMMELGEIIIKPINRSGGAGVLYLTPADKNFNSLIEMSTNENREHIIAQQYLPEIREGDKRVILVNGEPLGGLLRTPSPEDHRGNIHVGGTVSLSPLNEHDTWLIKQVQEKIKEDGLYFVGLDIIGDYITEINVTSPTGIQEIHQLGGVDIAKEFWLRMGDFSG